MTLAMAPRAHLLLVALLTPAACGLAFPPALVRAQTFAEEVAQASYVEPLVANGESDPRAVARRTVEIEIVRQLARHRGGHAEAIAQIIQMSRSFDVATAAEMIDELAAAHLRAGDLNLAAEARRVLAEQYPGTPRAQDSLLWLVRLYSSSEMLHAHRQTSQAALDMLRQLPPNADVSKARTNAAVRRERRKPGVRADGDQTAAPYAIHLATQAMDRHPELADNAAIAYQRAIAARLAGQQKQAQAFLSPLKHRRGGDPWGDCARMEAWIESGDKERSPKLTAACVFADHPPQLDGVLTEPFWQTALPLPLRPSAAPAANSPAVQPAAYDRPASIAPAATPTPPAGQVQFAYDREYLYLAVVCEQAPGVRYAAADGPRPRDAEIDAQDHVVVRLDLDRDYATYFELFVDSRGCTADRCWGDSAWNPQWYVAVGELDPAAAGNWIVEIAIPWKELTRSPPKSNETWACSIARMLPATATQPPQSWVGPASNAPGPESFGVIRFE
jgi:hypothetical protein